MISRLPHPLNSIVAKRLDMSGGRTVMDLISESLLKEFSKERNIEQLEEDERFEHFCSFLGVSRHHAESFDTADVVTRVDQPPKGKGKSKAKSSGGNDTGIDGVAILINGSLVTDVEEFEGQVESWPYLEVKMVFIQAERSPSFDTAKIGTFGFAVSDFFKSTPSLPRNEKVSSAADVMNAIYKRSSKFRGNPSLDLYYMTTGKWVGDANLEARRAAVVEDLNGTGLFSTVLFNPVDAKALQSLYQRTRNAISKDFLFLNRTTMPEIPGVNQAHLGYLPASEFIKLLEDENGDIMSRLFYDNVRDWQGDNDVNLEVENTLKSTDNNRFVLMNNGVTIIARTLQPTGHKFHIEDYQIVNGCQTSHVLFNNRNSLTDQVLIPVRIIATHDDNVVNSIIRATNRQTQVTEDQFFALEEFPKQLEAFFKAFPVGKQLFFERRDMQYSRMEIEKTRIITRANTIKAFAAMFLDEPHRTTRDYASVTVRVGKDIFGKTHRMEPYYTAAFALYVLEYMFRNKKLEPKYKAARFHILLAARLLSGDSEMPAMNANKMEGYCNKITEVLWDLPKAESLMIKAAGVIDKAAVNNFHRDNIRTERFTKTVLASVEKPAQPAPKGKRNEATQSKNIR